MAVVVPVQLRAVREDGAELRPVVRLEDRVVRFGPQPEELSVRQPAVGGWLVGWSVGRLEVKGGRVVDGRTNDRWEADDLLMDRWSVVQWSIGWMEGMELQHKTLNISEPLHGRKAHNTHVDPTRSHPSAGCSMYASLSASACYDVGVIDCCSCYRYPPPTGRWMQASFSSSVAS